MANAALWANNALSSTNIGKKGDTNGSSTNLGGNYQWLFTQTATSVSGIGDTAAESLAAAYAEKPFNTLDDVRSRTKLTGTNIDDLKKHGLFKGLPESAQISIFDL